MKSLFLAICLMAQIPTFATTAELPTTLLFPRLWMLVNTIHSYVWTTEEEEQPVLPAVDEETGLQLLYHIEEMEEEEPIKLIHIVYGTDVKVSKKGSVTAVSPHACYVEFQGDTDNSTSICFRDKSDADKFAGQMELFITYDPDDPDYGTVGRCYANLKPRKNENGWWEFNFHAG